MVGLAQGAIDVAVPYTKERQQFKKPIFEFQVIILLLIYSRNMFVIFNFWFYLFFHCFGWGWGLFSWTRYFVTLRFLTAFIFFLVIQSHEI